MAPLPPSVPPALALNQAKREQHMDNDQPLYVQELLAAAKPPEAEDGSASPRPGTHSAGLEAAPPHTHAEDALLATLMLP